MNIKTIAITAALILSTSLNAGSLYMMNKEVTAINQCPIVFTDHPFDLALTNKGYFVVSQGKKDSEQLFTRFGRIALDRDGYLRSHDGDYLLAVTKKSDPRHLNKIKISSKNLPPKATSKIETSINFPATAIEEGDFRSSVVIYDSLSQAHVADMRFAKTTQGVWNARIFVDSVYRDEGTLTFSADGKFMKQKGLAHIQWPAEYGMHELSIDFKTSTQFASPFSIQWVQADGYALGTLMAAGVTIHGEIDLIYSNGQHKMLKNRIAVAQFTNPGHLERINNRLYRPTEQSGQPRIHWKNGEYAVLGGALEEETCLIN